MGKSQVATWDGSTALPANANVPDSMSHGTFSNSPPPKVCSRRMLPEKLVRGEWHQLIACEVRTGFPQGSKLEFQYCESCEIEITDESNWTKREQAQSLVCPRTPDAICPATAVWRNIAKSTNRAALLCHLKLI